MSRNSGGNILASTLRGNTTGDGHTSLIITNNLQISAATGSIGSASEPYVNVDMVTYDVSLLELKATAGTDINIDLLTWLRERDPDPDARRALQHLDRPLRRRPQHQRPPAGHPVRRRHQGAAGRRGVRDPGPVVAAALLQLLPAEHRQPWQLRPGRVRPEPEPGAEHLQLQPARRGRGTSTNGSIDGVYAANDGVSSTTVINIVSLHGRLRSPEQATSTA